MPWRKEELDRSAYTVRYYAEFALNGGRVTPRR
jgi:hypothetical protein